MEWFQQVCIVLYHINGYNPSRKKHVIIKFVKLANFYMPHFWYDNEWAEISNMVSRTIWMFLRWFY